MPMSWGKSELVACIEQKEVQDYWTGMNKGEQVDVRLRQGWSWMLYNLQALDRGSVF